MNVDADANIGSGLSVEFVSALALAPTISLNLTIEHIMEVDYLNVGADAHIGSGSVSVTRRFSRYKLDYLNVGGDTNIGNECWRGRPHRQ
jgi:hypothetical protein